MAFDIVFLGSDCEYSRIILEALIEARLRITAVWLAGQNLPGLSEETTIQSLLPPNAAITENDPNAFQLTSTFVQESVLKTTWQHGIPLYGIKRVKAEETRRILKSLAPMLGVVACFPRRLPEPLLSVPRYGFLNVHPSLLPDYRGPSPIFWQFRAGEQQTGVTVHWMDAEFDTGPIASQRLVPLADGISEHDATRLMARAGGRALVDVLHHVAGGELPYRRQPAGGSHQPWPGPQDFSISPDWPARRIYNFMRATAVWGIPYILKIDEQEWLLSDVLYWSNYVSIDSPYEISGDIITFLCSPGAIQARLYQPNPTTTSES
jgi:methionyl-tRNA formyltransferase